MTVRAASAALAAVLALGSGGAGSQREAARLQTELDQSLRVDPADAGHGRLVDEVVDRLGRQSSVITEPRVSLETLSLQASMPLQELAAGPDFPREVEIALDDAHRSPQVAAGHAFGFELLPPPPKPRLASALLPPPPKPERSDLQVADAASTGSTSDDPGHFRDRAAARASEGRQFAQLPEPRPPEPIAPEPDTSEPSPARPTAPKPAPPRPPAPVASEPEKQVPVEEEPLAAAPQEPEPERIEPGEQLLIEARGLLLPAGTLQVEPNLDYTYSSSDRVAISGFTIFEAIVIGQVQVDDLERNIVQTAADLRYGLTDRIQTAVRIPYVYRTEKEIIAVGTANQQKITSDGNGLGDVEASVSWQPPLPPGRWPDVIVTDNAIFPTGEDPFEIDTREVQLESGATRRVLEDAPTGSGFYGAGLSSTLVWRIDPVVYFLGGGYTLNFEADKGSEFGEIDPGDEFELFSGLNIGLNESVALNMSFVAQFINETEQNGETRDGTDVTDARAVFGSSIALTPRTSLLGGVAIGLTDQSPDFQLTVRLPMNFDVF